MRASDHTADVSRAHAHRERELHRDRVQKKDGNPVYVLATCADLLLKEIRDLNEPSVYFHASRTVTCKTIDLEAIDQEPPQEVLYLLASVGAALSPAHQENVGKNVVTLDNQQKGRDGRVSYRPRVPKQTERDQTQQRNEHRNGANKAAGLRGARR